MIIKSALTEIHQFSKLCPNPKRALSQSKAVIEYNMKLAKRTLRMNLLQNLQKQSLGTKDAEQIEIKLRRETDKGKRDTGIIRHIMEKKIKDAEKDEKNTRREFKTAKDLVNSEIDYKSEEGKILRRIQKELTNTVWIEGKEKNKSYIENIMRVYGEKKVKVSEFRGVKVGDKHLEEKVDTEVRIYGDIEISDETKEILKLPPKFATFKELRIEDIQTEVEKAMAKLRMKANLNQMVVMILKK